MESSFLEELLPAGLGFRRRETPATFEERHLGGKMAAFANLDPIPPRQEIDEVGTAIAAGACEPERMGHGKCVCPS